MATAASALAMGMSKTAAAGMGQMARGTLLALERSAEFRLMVRQKQRDIHARATLHLIDGGEDCAKRLVDLAMGRLEQSWTTSRGHDTTVHPDWSSQVRALLAVLDRIGVSPHGEQPAIEPEPNPFVGLSPEEARKALAMQVAPLLEAAGMMAVPLDGGGKGEGGEGKDSGPDDPPTAPNVPALSDVEADDGVILDLDAV